MLTTPEEVFGTSDCERVREAFLAQPCNALTSLAFVAAGLEIRRRRPDRAPFATLTALVGFGSFLAHGPRPRGSAWLHDVTIAWALAGVALDGRRAVWRRLVLVLLGMAFWVFPEWRNQVSALAAAGVIATEVGFRRSRGALLALGLLGLGAAVGNLCRTGGRFCNPDSLIQGHGAWHVMAAGALAAWGVGAPLSCDG